MSADGKSKQEPELVLTITSVATGNINSQLVQEKHTPFTTYGDKLGHASVRKKKKIFVHEIGQCSQWP